MKRLSCLVLMLCSASRVSPWRGKSRSRISSRMRSSPAFSLSPDGKHIAVTVPQDDRTVLAVLRVADKSWSASGTTARTAISAVSGSTMIACCSPSPSRPGSFDFEVVERRHVCVQHRWHPAHRHSERCLLQHRRPDPRRSRHDPGRALGRNAFLSKLNVYNGGSPVATAPVDYGSFLVDHERKVRYVFGEMKDGRERHLPPRWRQVDAGARERAQRRHLPPVGFAADNHHVYWPKARTGSRIDCALDQRDRRGRTAVRATESSPSAFPLEQRPQDAAGGRATRMASRTGTSSHRDHPETRSTPAWSRRSRTRRSASVAPPMTAVSSPCACTATRDPGQVLPVRSQDGQGQLPAVGAWTGSSRPRCRR